VQRVSPRFEPIVIARFYRLIELRFERDRAQPFLRVGVM
jgi:hypothetical protein